MSFKQRNILIIDDSAGIRTFLNVSLQGVGAQIYEAHTADAGLKLYSSVKPDVVILDLGLPDADGLELLPLLRSTPLEDGKQPAIIVLTVRNDSYTRKISRERGANGYITKPFMVEELYEAIEEVLH